MHLWERSRCHRARTLGLLQGARDKWLLRIVHNTPGPKARYLVR